MSQEENYNVGSDRWIGIGELAYLVRDLLSPDKAVDILGKSNVDVGNPTRDVYVPNVDLAKNTLGLEVWTDLATAIKSTASHAKGGSI